ncbi:MAG TPA: hypothetical protein VGI39_37800, partial [Polyangiaceae bacterium]
TVESLLLQGLPRGELLSSPLQATTPEVTRAIKPNEKNVVRMRYRGAVYERGERARIEALSPAWMMGVAEKVRRHVDRGSPIPATFLPDAAAIRYQRGARDLGRAPAPEAPMTKSFPRTLRRAAHEAALLELLRDSPWERAQRECQVAAQVNAFVPAETPSAR